MFKESVVNNEGFHEKMARIKQIHRTAPNMQNKRRKRQSELTIFVLLFFSIFILDFRFPKMNSPSHQFVRSMTFIGGLNQF